jgi:hypothetical protein
MLMSPVTLLRTNAAGDGFCESRFQWPTFRRRPLPESFFCLPFQERPVLQERPGRIILHIIHFMKHVASDECIRRWSIASSTSIPTSSLFLVVPTGRFRFTLLSGRIRRALSSGRWSKRGPRRSPTETGRTVLPTWRRSGPVRRRDTWLRSFVTASRSAQNRSP